MKKLNTVMPYIGLIYGITGIIFGLNGQLKMEIGLIKSIQTLSIGIVVSLSSVLIIFIQNNKMKRNSVLVQSFYVFLVTYLILFGVSELLMKSPSFLTVMIAWLMAFLLMISAVNSLLNNELKSKGKIFRNE